MTPQDWQRVKELFAEALEREGSDRDLFIQQICGQDESTGREVKRLVAEHGQADGFLEEVLPGGSDLAGILEQENGGKIADGDTTGRLAIRRIGPYAILREIGHGGMGTVYLAERDDGQYRKRVAIKLVNPHLGSEEILRRFRNERQVLAGLNHPHITQLLDGGTTEDGRPYLVMEYVEGMAINAWCHSRKSTVPDRLRLFRKVCAAVQYAHDKQVIHRDIKPGNILVTTEGIPKLLDFGISKVLSRELSAETFETTRGYGPMTPEYASPEQIRGERIGPASDLYSLGVVLYQLLTGRLPYALQNEAYGQLSGLICEQEPAKPSVAAMVEMSREVGSDSPSGLRRLLAGGLDQVVLKALRKDPQERYGSLAEFSEDIERYLQDMPVRARPENLLYRAGKHLRRNRLKALAAALGTTLVAVLIVDAERYRSPARGPGVTRSLNDERSRHFTFERIASLGDSAAGDGSYVSYFEPYGLNGRGDLAFVAHLSTGGDGAFLLPKSGGLLPLARQGQAAPGGGIFEGTTLGHISTNSSGDVAFVFGLKPFNAAALKGFLKAGLFFYRHSEGAVTALVIPGVTTAPGFGTLESTGQHAAMNAASDVVFPGVVRTMQGVAPANGLGQGIFLTKRHGHVTTVVAPGDPAPGGGRFDFAANPWINDRGDIAFGAHVAGEQCIAITPGCMESVYFRSAATGKIESIAHQGGQAAGGNFYRGAWGPTLNNNGDLAFMGELTPQPGVTSARGIFLYSRGETTAVARPGDLMPDGRKLLTVNPVSSAGNYSLNNRGEVSFNALLEDGGSGLYVYSRGVLHLVAGTGTVIPGVGTVASVAGLIGGTLNDGGQVFFWASLKDGRGVLLVATPTSQVAKEKF